MVNVWCWELISIISAKQSVNLKSSEIQWTVNFLADFHAWYEDLLHQMVDHVSLSDHVQEISEMMVNHGQTMIDHGQVVRLLQGHHW